MGERSFSPFTNWETPRASATASCCSPKGGVRGIGTLSQLRAQTGNSAVELEDVFLALT